MGGVIFHTATELDANAIAWVQAQVRRRRLRVLARRRERDRSRSPFSILPNPARHASELGNAHLAVAVGGSPGGPQALAPFTCQRGGVPIRASRLKEIAMIGYVTLGTNDLPRAKAFYDTLLAEIGVKRLMEFDGRGYAWAAAALLRGHRRTFDFAPTGGVIFSATRPGVRDRQRLCLIRPPGSR
jgi:hypothetical protein